MKITVKTEAEKKIMDRFLTMIHTFDAFEEIRRLDEENPDEFGDTFLDGMEYRLLSENFPWFKVEVDSSAPEMGFDDHFVITGTCTVCGIQTEGTLDGEFVPWSEYLHSCDPDVVMTWKCESCFNEHE